MGFVSKDELESKLRIWMCEPKPISFRRISLLNPVTVQMEMIITARLSAIPYTDIFENGPGNGFLTAGVNSKPIGYE